MFNQKIILILKQVKPYVNKIIQEGLNGGGGVWYSLLIKKLAYYLIKTLGYSLKYDPIVH